MISTTFYAFAGTLGLFLALSLLSKTAPGTIKDYFWGGKSLPRWSVANLLTSNSFSLNGLLYQAWLGYLVGWWAIGIQLVWCSSFMIIGLRSTRFQEIVDQGTLHGVIASRFGSAAGKLAAVASLIGFTGLIGWEAVVGATFLKEIGGLQLSLYALLPILLALVAAFYTRSGGLKGNSVMNIRQNVGKGVILIAATAFLIATVAHTGVQALWASSSATKGLSESLLSLGGVALAANLLFSAFWQPVDMSFWQSLAGLSDGGQKNPKVFWTIALAAFLVFLFPGLIGTLMGIALSDVSTTTPGITDTNVLNVFATMLVGSPVLYVLVICAFAAAMLSTIDGYALAASQALTWDLLYPSTVRNLLNRADGAEADEDDKKVIAAGRLAVFAVALIGSLGMIFFVEHGVSLFSLVYIVVVGQMSLTGPVLAALFWKRIDNAKAGWLPIAASLVLGLYLVYVGVVARQDALTWAPVATIGLSCLTTLGVLLYNRATL